MGAGIKEQVAGLLHDVSHTAFSHLVDWVVGDPTKDDYQDKHHDMIIKNSEIPGILSKYDIKTEEILDYSNYLLLEKDAPSLCADRVDYSFRDIYHNRHIYDLSIEMINKMKGDVKAVGSQIVFSSKKEALKFGRIYSRCQREHWAGVEPTLRHKLFGEALKIALNEGTIEESDFFEDDEFVMSKLKKSDNDKIKEALEMIDKGVNFEIDEESPQIILKRKFRYVDPEYLEEGKIKILSENDLSYKNFIDEEKRMNEAGMKVNILPRKA